MRGTTKNIAVYFLAAFCLLLFSCSGGEENKQEMRIAMLTDYSSIDDKSFNQITWEGVCRWADEHNLPRENYEHQSSQSTTDAYALQLANFADKKFDLIIAPGFFFTEAVNIVAQKYPQQKFLLIDSIAEVKDNVTSVTFANNEGSFLVGVAAALKAKEMGSKKLGFIGGFDNVVIREFAAGFTAGAKVITPSIKILQKYTNDFSNPRKGQRFAKEMYDEGVGIIFNVAGATGLGIIEEAKKRAAAGEEVFVVGVDRNQYNDGIYDEKNSVILTSMLKKVDVAAYGTLSQVARGEFHGGNIVYALKNNGVGIPENNPNLKKEWLDTIKQYEQDIINGTIDVPRETKRPSNKEE